MKRFWHKAGIAPEGDGWCVMLDARALTLPGIGVLRLGSDSLAIAVANEWRDAAEMDAPVDIAQMRLTRLAGATQSCLGAVATDIAAQLERYTDSDLLCYRADAPDLAARQAAQWQPWLDWAAQRYGIQFAVTDSLMPIAQSDATRAGLMAAIAKQPASSLVALAMIVPIFGSLVLGLAVVERQLEPLIAFALAHMEEDFQGERWGGDAEALARRKEIAVDLAAIGRFLAICRA